MNEKIIQILVIKIFGLRYKDHILCIRYNREKPSLSAYNIYINIYFKLIAFRIRPRVIYVEKEFQLKSFG